MPSRCDHLDVQHHDAGRPRVADVTSVAAVRLAPVIVTSAPVAIVRGQLMLVPADSAKPAMAAAIDLARDMRGIQAPSPCQDGSGMLAGVDNGPRQPDDPAEVAPRHTPSVPAVRALWASFFGQAGAGDRRRRAPHLRSRRCDT
jgi:hypothetical protein